MRVVCFDMDGVIFESRNFWLDLHKAYGTYEAGLELTRKYLHTDYARLVKEVVQGLWRGKDGRVYQELVKKQQYNPGAAELFGHIRANHWKTAIISSGSMDMARRAKQDFGIDYVYANELVIKNDRITGEFSWPIGAGGEKKAEILKTLCANVRATPKEAAYIGDSEVDIPAMNAAGLSIAFLAEDDKVKKAARFVVDKRDLRLLIPLLVEKDDF